MLDRLTQRSRGFGFVHFDTAEDLEEAIKVMHNHELDGRKISVTRAIPQSETAPGTPAGVLGSRGGPARYV
jgi:RNA recognition motif-containing protein